MEVGGEERVIVLSIGWETDEEGISHAIKYGCLILLKCLEKDGIFLMLCYQGRTLLSRGFCVICALLRWENLLTKGNTNNFENFEYLWNKFNFKSFSPFLEVHLSLRTCNLKIFICQIIIQTFWRRFWTMQVIQEHLTFLVFKILLEYHTCPSKNVRLESLEVWITYRSFAQ